MTTAPKPAAGGEGDEQLSPANEKFLNEMLAKPAGTDWHRVFAAEYRQHLETNAALAAANQRADAAEEAFRNAQTALVQTGRQLGQAEKLLRKVNSIGFTGPLADEIRSFLTPKESGNEVPVQNQGAGEVPATQGVGAQVHLSVADCRETDALAALEAFCKAKGWTAKLELHDGQWTVHLPAHGGRGFFGEFCPTVCKAILEAAHG